MDPKPILTRERPYRNGGRQNPTRKTTKEGRDTILHPKRNDVQRRQNPNPKKNILQRRQTLNLRRLMHETRPKRWAVTLKLEKNTKKG